MCLAIHSLLPIDTIFFHLASLGMVDEAGDQFVAYFLPTDETLVKRATDGDAGMDYTEEEVYDYKLGYCNEYYV